MRPALILILLTLTSAALSAADADHAIGRWKLNWARSHSAQPAPESAIREYAQTAGGVRVSETWKGPDGKTIELDYTAAYDGKDYPVKAGTASTVAFTRHDAHTAEGVSKTNGKVAYTFTRKVSRNGKTLTIEMAKRDSAGKPFKELLVYDRMN
jgi:hypothetical protein